MIDWNAFTPWSALAGGALIGLAAVLLLLGQGKILGISGVVSSLFKQKQGGSWRIGLVLGLIASSWLYAALGGQVPSVTMKPVLLVIIAGVLVGFGSRLGSGCTSGHGVCGIARLSLRSMVATLCFMFSGFATVYVGRHLLGLF